MSRATGEFDITSERLVPNVIPSPYCRKVLLGEWRAIEAVDEAVRTRSLRREACRETASQALEVPVSLALPADFVPISTCVQLLAIDTPGWPARTCGDNALALSAQAFEDDALVTCSPSVVSCARNVFLVEAEGGAKGQDLAYGQRFLLRPAKAPHLALRCEPPTLDTNLGLSKQPLVRLGIRTDRYSIWTVWPPHPRLRVEAAGSAVPAHTRLVLRHVASGQCLCAEYGHWARTLRGVECEATVHSALDPYGKETAANFWAFVIQKPAEIVTPVAERVHSCT